MNTSALSFKRKLGFVSFIVLASLSHPNYSLAMDDDPHLGLIQSMRPKRKTPYTVFQRQEKLDEFYLSAENRACGFRLFQEDRKEGIDLIKHALTDKSKGRFIKQCIQNEIQNLYKEESDVFKIIFPAFDNKISIETFASAPLNQTAYLNYMQDPESGKSLGVELCTIQNYFDDQKNPTLDGNNLKGTFGLMTALAYLKESNLYIYVKDGEDENKLHLIHRSVFFPNSSKSHRALFNGHHYNLLIDSKNEKEKERAHIQEERELKNCAESLIRANHMSDRLSTQEPAPDHPEKPFGLEGIEDTPKSPKEIKEKEINNTEEFLNTPSLSSVSGEKNSDLDTIEFFKKIKNLSIQRNDYLTKFALTVRFDCENKSYTYDYDLEKFMSYLPQNESRLIQDTFALYSNSIRTKSKGDRQGSKSLAEKFKLKILKYFLLAQKQPETHNEVLKHIFQLNASLRDHLLNHPGQTITSNPRVGSNKVSLNTALLKAKGLTSNFTKDSPLFLFLKGTKESELPACNKEIQKEYQEKNPSLRIFQQTTQSSPSLQSKTIRATQNLQTNGANKRPYNVAFPSVSYDKQGGSTFSPSWIHRPNQVSLMLLFPYNPNLTLPVNPYRPLQSTPSCSPPPPVYLKSIENLLSKQSESQQDKMEEEQAIKSLQSLSETPSKEN